MNTASKILSVSCAGLLSACASWPKEGNGGFAEFEKENLLSVEHNYKVQAKHGLRFDYSLLKHQLSLLELEGAFYCFPASVDDAKKRETRIIRELTGSMFASASTNIVVQRIALHELELKLSYALTHAQCAPPTSYAKNLQHQNLLNLLNSDNQFAVDSSELNQKYRNNLDQASDLLSAKTNIRLLIVGNTDAKGKENHNLQLSQRRAKAVQSYLISAGLKANNIDIIASGEHSPLYKDDSDAARLINRNVRVYLIEG